MENLNVNIQPTPNPNALKFILSQKIKGEGKSSYKSPLECKENPLACALFTIRGIDQLHFFENVITVTKFGYEEWEALEMQITDCLNDRVPGHDPDYYDPDPEAERRKSLSSGVLAIEDILDRTIRPGLQGDGGDIQCLTYEENVLVVRYQGACGTCPSASTGTLEAIKSILRDELDNPEIEVYIAPDF